MGIYQSSLSVCQQLNSLESTYFLTYSMKPTLDNYQSQNFDKNKSTEQCYKGIDIKTSTKYKIAYQNTS